MTADRKLSQIFAAVLVLAASSVGLGQESSRTGPPPADKIRVTPLKADRLSRPEGSPIPGRVVLEAPQQNDFTTPDGFTHFHLDVNSGCQFTDHSYALNIPLNPARLSQISYLMTNYDVDYNDPQGCLGGPEVDLMKFNNNSLGILTGANDSWSINKWALTRARMVNGSNAIFIDTDSTGTGCWCVGVGYIEVIAKVDFKVKEFKPADNDKNRDFHANKVDITTTFTLEYDTATLTANTFKVEYRDAGGNWQPVAGTFSQLAPEKFRFTPGADLKDGIRYRATVVSGASGVKAKAGGAMLSADRVWYFWTVPDLSVSDAFDYGSGTTCPPAANPCPGLDLNIFQTARNKNMVPNKNAVARIYHRWKRHTDVHADDQVKDLKVKDKLGTPGTKQQTVKRPDRYTATETKAAGNTVNIYHNPGTTFSYTLESTPLPQTNATPVKFMQTRNLTSTGSSPTMKFDYYFLKDGAWSGGVPAAAKTEGRSLMTSGSRQITDQFPVLGTTYKEKGTHSIGYTLTGSTINDAVCTTVNQVSCPSAPPGAATNMKELDCAYQKLQTMRGGHKFVAATVNKALCPIATGFAMGGKVFFHNYSNGANQYTITHEVGHVYGISKANNPTPGHRNVSTGVEGFQVRTKENRSNVENQEISLMFTSAQPHKWVDNTDYDDLIAAGITSAFPRVEDAAAVVSPFLIVSGYADSSTAAFSSVFLQDTPNDTSDPSGTHTVELLNGSNSVLSSATVTPGVDLIIDERNTASASRPADPQATPSLMPYFSVSLPWDPSAQKVRIRSGGLTLLTYTRTAISPTVTIGAPTDGASLSGTVPVTWTGLDSDSPALAYQLQLSEDGGSTWTPLIPLTDATSYSLDTTLLASGTGRQLRVMVTDGFNTGYGVKNVTIVNPLGVQNVEPEDGATGVLDTTSVSGTFTTGVNASTLFSGFKMVKQGETTGLVGTITYYPDSQYFEFQPDDALIDDTTYVVTLTGVQDVNGNALAAPYQWSFTVGPDSVQPLVVATSPGEGELDVPLSPLVVAQFSEFMDPATVNGTTFQVKGPGAVAVPGSVAYNSLVGQAVFTPSGLLSPNTQYDAVVTTGAHDVAGNALGAAASWSFTTGTVVNTGGVRLLGNYDDEAVDEDGDGLFDRLYVLVDVEIKTPGTHYYNLNGRLLDKDGHLIEWRSPGFFFVPPGFYTFYIDFTGSVIRGHNVNGPYTLDSLNLYSYDNPNDADTKFDIYQTFPYQVSDFFSLMTFSGLPDQILKKGTTRNDAFNLRSYTTHQTQPVSSVTYSIFINSDPAVGVSIDGSANIDINPGPTVEAESDVTIEAKDTLGNVVHTTFHISVQASAPTNLVPTYAATMTANGSQDVTVDIFDQFAALFTQSTTVDLQSTLGTFTPPSVLTSTGHATSSFSPGGAVGTAFITATAGTAQLQFSIVSGFSPGDINAAGLLVDPAADGALSDGNGVFEPGETVLVEPSWNNATVSLLNLSGTASTFTGPPGATYTLNDPNANYGSIVAGGTNNCGTATGNCYEMTVSNPATRPATHWDATFTEALYDGDPGTVRKLHVGQSFTDVPKTHTFYPFIERIFHNGVTTGCTGTTYCPEDNVFRLQMAIFIARAQAGGDANIPASGTAQGNPYNCTAGGTSSFTDIQPTDPFCRHVHYIFSTGVTTGCITTPPRQYCPGANVTRGQMALFIGRAVAGSDAAVPVAYGPDPVTGRSYSCNVATPNLHFTDITTSDIFCRHTHFLWAKDVISGFPDGTYGPNLFVPRGAMAKFLANGFNLRLYGP